VVDLLESYDEADWEGSDESLIIISKPAVAGIEALLQPDRETGIAVDYVRPAVSRS
jgi:hypothetical protein